MKDSPSVPQAPDPLLTAQAQGQLNTDAARTQARLNRVNQQTPWGNLSYTQNGDNPDSWNANITLSPDQQALLTQQSKLAQQYGGIGENLLGAVGQQYSKPMDTSGLTGWGSQPKAGTMPVQGNISDSIGSPGQLSTGEGIMAATQAPLARQAGYGQIQDNLGPQNYTQDAMRVQNAIMQRMRPELETQRNSMENKLANQGIMQGSEAYNNEQRLRGQAENDALSQAVMSGYGQANQLFGQNLQAGQFANQAQNQGFGQSIANANLQNNAAAQDFGQNLAQEQFRNATVGQNYQQLMGAANLQNQAQQQNFGQQYNMQGLDFQQQLAAQNAANTQRGQQFGEQSTLYNQPLNTMNALRTGSQVTAPQFMTPPGVGTTAGNFQQGAQNQYQGALNAYNQQIGQNNQTTSGLFQLGAAALPLMFSDARLKSDIERIGTHPLGIGIYEYDIFGHRERGVMAQEVLTVNPAAVVEHVSGYLMVDYGRLGHA